MPKEEPKDILVLHVVLVDKVGDVTIAQRETQFVEIMNV